MFHARIVSPRGSLYLAAEATPYDLENLRTHVHDLCAATSADTRVELRIDRPSSTAAYLRVSSLLEQLEAEGVHTVFSLAGRDGAAAPPKTRKPPASVRAPIVAAPATSRGRATTGRTSPTR
jgi:hypothetical protein